MARPCLDCGRPTSPGRHPRGLCETCYARHRYHGTHLDFPAKVWRNDELMDEWSMLRGEGFTRRQAADRLGITKKRLEKAIERHQHREKAAA